MVGSGLQQVDLFGIEDDDDIDLVAEFNAGFTDTNYGELLDDPDLAPAASISTGMERRWKKSDLDFPNNGLLIVDQVAMMFNVDARTVHRWVREGRLGCVQLSRTKRLFNEEQIQAFIRNRTIEPPVPSAQKKPIDLKSADALRSNRKGGDESQGNVSFRALKEEMRQWR